MVVPVLGLAPLAAGPAQADPPDPGPRPVVPVPDDFNGDGYGDLVVADPGASVDGHAGAGAVTVLYGSATGLADGTRRTLTQNSPEVPGSAADGAAFGQSVAAGDLDRDGWTDLVVGAPRQAVDGVADAGTVTILWGGSDGFAEATLLPPTEVPGEGCQWGLTLLADGMSSDGVQDLSVGTACSTHFLVGPFTRDGVPADVLTEYRPGVPGATGHVDNDPQAERILLRGPSDNSPGGSVWVDDWVDGQLVPTIYSSFFGRPEGTAAAAGDVNLDGHGDLILGNTYDGVTNWPVGGHVTVIPGWGGVPPTSGGYRLHQGSLTPPVAAEYGDAFGASLSTGDVNGDGYVDLAVGVPGKDVAGRQDAGAVVVLYGSDHGLAGIGAQWFDAGSFGGDDVLQAGARFGQTVRLADHDGDGRAELTVGAPGEAGVGCVWNAVSDDEGRVDTAGATRVCGGETGPHVESVAFGGILSP
ncbi:FG-GAP and VCBS repeat-containing protein [Streptomyces hainanensis]|nr:FG-GAP and VCBS repeat-containing protein [Streptomyces hainanensis]